MRNRILIVALGISLGLGARLGVDLYHHLAHPPASQEKAAPESTDKAKVAASSPVARKAG